MGRAGIVLGSDGRCNAPRFAAAAVALAIVGAEALSPEIGNGGAGTGRRLAGLCAFADRSFCEAAVFSAFSSFFCNFSRREDIFENARDALVNADSAVRAASRAA